MNAQRVLDICQQLYEKHKLITYPRSDCRYLPTEHFSQASSIVDAISTTSKELSGATKGVDFNLKSKAWNDKKVEAHHAIIPTPKSLSSASLSSDELNIYQQIARQYLMQFYLSAIYAEAKLVFDIGSGVFVAKGRQMLSGAGNLY